MFWQVVTTRTLITPPISKTSLVPRACSVCIACVHSHAHTQQHNFAAHTRAMCTRTHLHTTYTILQQIGEQYCSRALSPFSGCTTADCSTADPWRTWQSSINGVHTLVSFFCTIPNITSTLYHNSKLSTMEISLSSSTQMEAINISRFQSPMCWSHTLKVSTKKQTIGLDLTRQWHLYENIRMHCKSTLAANVTCNPPFKGTPPHKPLFRRSSQSNLLSRASLLTNITWGCPPTVISLPRYLSTATSLRGCPISLLSRPSLPLFVRLLESLSMRVFSRLFCLFW